MITKAPAVVKKVIKDGNETAIVLLLSGNNTTSLEDGEKVYVELTNATSGSKVEFFHAPLAKAEVPVAAPQVEELDLSGVADDLKEVEKLEPPVEEVVAPIIDDVHAPAPQPNEELPDAPPEVSPSVVTEP